MNVILDFADCAGLRVRRVFRSPRQAWVAHTLAEVRPLLHQVSLACSNGAYAAGFISYEAAAAFDAAAATHAPVAGLPLARFAIYDAPDPGWSEAVQAAPIPPASWSRTLDYPAFAAALERLRLAIADGDAYQVNLTLQQACRFSGSSLALYEHLRLTQDADFSAWISWPEGALLSLSPELFFQTCGSRIETRPMKGTGAISVTADLANCPKNRAENLMIVDLLRSDLGRIAIPGSVAVHDLFRVENYPTVRQMTSTVCADLRPQTGLEEMFAALFPCGSVTGAPKLSAMQWIRDLEPGPRGVYCGAVGWIRPGGDAQFNVPIRTLWHDSPAQSLRCGLGGGITWDSSAAGEWEEIGTKARFLEVVELPAELLETMLLEQGRWPHFHGHARRLINSAQQLDFPRLDAERYSDALDRYAAQFPAGRYRVRLRYNRRGNLHLEGYPLEDREYDTPATVRLADRPFHFTALMAHKTTDRRAYEEACAGAAADPGCFDVLLWNEQGELTEFTRGNLVVERDGRKFTPPLACGVLPGVLRQSLCDSGALEEKCLAVADLGSADRLWFINSVRGWVPVKMAGEASAADPVR